MFLLERFTLPRFEMPPLLSRSIVIVSSSSSITLMVIATPVLSVSLLLTSIDPSHLAPMWGRQGSMV